MNVHIISQLYIYELLPQLIFFQPQYAQTICCPFAQTIDGAVILISPVENWGMDDVNPAALIEMPDWQQPFSLGPNGRQTLTFRMRHISSLPAADVSYWIVAKLSYFGNVDYRPSVGKLEIVKAQK